MKRYSHGYSLLELLIAIFILAIGLLGMAAMQAVSLKSNQEAQFRTAALSIAEDLASRMRANRNYINLTTNEFSLIPANHVNYNLYSSANYNADPSDAVPPSATLTCTDPNAASDETELQSALNCMTNIDIEDIRRQVNPDSLALTNPTGRILPTGTLLYVDCNDKPNLDYLGADDLDPCSPGSVHTIYVIWPVSAGRVEAGELDNAGNNRQLLNTRCADKLTLEDPGLLPRDAGCVVLDIVP